MSHLVIGQIRHAETDELLDACITEHGVLLVRVGGHVVAQALGPNDEGAVVFETTEFSALDMMHVEAAPQHSCEHCQDGALLPSMVPPICINCHRRSA